MSLLVKFAIAANERQQGVEIARCRPSNLDHLQLDLQIDIHRERVGRRASEIVVGSELRFVRVFQHRLDVVAWIVLVADRVDEPAFNRAITADLAVVVVRKGRLLPTEPTMSAATQRLGRAATSHNQPT